MGIESLYASQNRINGELERHMASGKLPLEQRRLSAVKEEEGGSEGLLNERLKPR